MKLAPLALLLSIAACWPAAAQTVQWDTSGNGLLKGTYYFREVFYVVGDQSGDLREALALYGNATFDGAGKYTMTATLNDSSAQVLQNGTLSGTYSIAASGYGFLSNPLSSGDFVYGLVSKQGIFIGSSTEAPATSGFNDLFVAAPLSSPAPTNATFKGTYWISDTDLSSGSPAGAISTLFQLNPDGAGNLGNVTLTGYVGQGGSQLFTQTASGVKYSFSNGAASVAFPNSTSLAVAGQKFLYISPDGNFVFGGSPTSWDFFVGVRTGAGSATPNLSGLYYQAGIDEDAGLLDLYYGSLAAGNGSIVGHQRLSSAFFTNAIDSSYSDAYSVKSDGTYSTTAMRYAVSAGGDIRIGSGIGPLLGLNVALAAPSISGDGVFLSPQGVVNGASSAPFTAGIAPGELLTLYGANLANTTLVASSATIPTTLAGVQVMINGIAAPVYVVSPGQISAYVPYGITGSLAQIQVNNNGTASNTVTMFVSETAPGVFTIPSGGLGNAAVLHADFSLVTTSHPAVVGETVLVYLTGLGAVNPAVSDGAPAPDSPLSNATATPISADIDGTTATISFAGLVPTAAGLYQINLAIPAGLATGNHLLDIGGPDSYTSEAIIPVGTATASAVIAPLAVLATPAVQAARRPAVNRIDVKNRKRVKDTRAGGQ